MIGISIFNIQNFDCLDANVLVLDTIFDFSGAKLLFFGYDFLVFGNGILAEFQVRVSSLSTTPKNEIAKNPKFHQFAKISKFVLISYFQISIQKKQKLQNFNQK